MENFKILPNKFVGKYEITILNMQEILFRFVSFLSAKCQNSYANEQKIIFRISYKAENSCMPQNNIILHYKTELRPIAYQTCNCTKPIYTYG